MPLIGIIDPSHDELKADEAGRTPNWLTLDELLAVADSASPKWSPWTWELLNAVLKTHEERDYISTSLLTTPCPRSAVLERKEDYISDTYHFYAAMRGTMIHRILEHGVRDRGLAEWRFWTTVGDTTLSGRPDLVTYGPEPAIWDYKTTENPPSFGYPYTDHKLQVQFNRYIVNHAEKWVNENDEPADIPFNPREQAFEHVVVVYLGPKGPKPIEVETTRMVKSPTGKDVKRKMPYVWNDEEVLDEMVPRIEAFNLALESYPEWPKGLEKMWGGEPGWQCPSYPWCKLPRCLAKRYPRGLTWPKQTK